MCVGGGSFGAAHGSERAGKVVRCWVFFPGGVGIRGVHEDLGFLYKNI